MNFHCMVKNKMFVQSYLVFDNIIKTLAQKSYLHIIQATFIFWNIFIWTISN